MLRSAALGRPLQCARHAPSCAKPRATGQRAQSRHLRLVVDDKLVLKPTGDGDTKHLEGGDLAAPTAIDLGQQMYTVGREDPCNIILPYPTVSGRHAELNVGTETVDIVDLESTNGTYINGEECKANQKQVLNVGDEVVFGDVHLACFELQKA